jgi:hypothetical protein
VTTSIESSADLIDSITLGAALAARIHASASFEVGEVVIIGGIEGEVTVSGTKDGAVTISGTKANIYALSGIKANSVTLEGTMTVVIELDGRTDRIA